MFLFLQQCTVVTNKDASKALVCTRLNARDAVPVTVCAADQLIVFFKGPHNNDFIAHDWSHLNDTRLQIFGWLCADCVDQEH